MWKSYLSLMILLSVVAAKAENVQFDRVNTTMQVIADYVVIGDDQVEFAKPKFDESFSNLTAEKIKYDVFGLVKNTPWNSGIKSEMSASCSMVSDRNPNHMGIDVVSNAKVKSDVLAMVRQGSRTGLKNHHVSNNDPMSVKIQNNLLRGTSVQTLTDLFQILLDSQKLTIEVYEDKIKRQIEYIQCLKAGNCGTGPSNEEYIKWAEQHLETLKAIKTSYEKVEVTAFPASSYVQKIVVISRDALGFAKQGRFELEPNLVLVSLENNELNGEFRAFVPVEKQRLDKLKNDLERVAYGLQNGSLETKEDTFRVFRDGLFQFKRVITGDWPNH